jgi:myosin heavy subunit
MDLQKLIDTLNSSNRHYIRCVKPNDDKAYRTWDAKKVYEQLSCNGVHETVTLRKAGYPNRVPFDRFLAR